ncbi:DUF1559 domain-containing protein [Lentisphaera profundi]|uniref:DUF1559 domain-containing protein n=1 Tax=Lentisphaera profundi TaxID=1658616 RepID=A0ABY7VXL6_9BACT|nr:DUF1559 domain-containing protein [Lentisphaera profundi]WDE97602.1 DUF1559 domain-containing protein [Lentisphaera profundi]
MISKIKSIKAFTLMELLVVVAIIGILASLLLPSLSSARKSAKQASCTNNLRQIGIANYNYLDDNDSTLPWGAWSNSSPIMGWGWDDLIYPYLGKGEMSLTDQYKWFWTEEQGLDTLKCPGAVSPYLLGDKPTGTYIMPRGNNGAANTRIAYQMSGNATNPPWTRKITDISDAQGTLLLTENDSIGGNPIQGLGRGATNPQKQIDPAGNGLQLVATANYTLEIHNKMKVNFLLIDGHVESHSPTSKNVLGENGTPNNPLGMWTVSAGD